MQTSHRNSWIARQPLRRTRVVVKLALGRRALPWLDACVAAGLAMGIFLLYAHTLLPGLGSRDTAELQWVVPTLSLAHPTGYPFYTLLGWLWCQLPLGGTPAWRMNLFSAGAGGLALGVMYLVARALGQRRPVAAAAALALGVSRTFWSQATIAEVYALAALIQALLLLALLRWRAGRWPLWLAGLLFGLGLAHHRSIMLLAPGALLLLLLSGAPRPRRGQWLAALAAMLLSLLCYLYVPLRAPEWMQSWRQVADHMSGASLTGMWLNPARLRADGLPRLLELARRFVAPQFLLPGAGLAVLGAGRLLRRDRAAAGLLLLSYTLVCAFCAAYYVDDIEVFFIPAHQLVAPLIGEGAMLLLALLPGTRTSWRRESRAALVACTLFVLPALLFWRNLPAVRTLNTSADELIAREVMAQPLPPGALVVGDWYATEGPHYLQVIEHLRPDVQFGVGISRDALLDALGHGRAVYLTAPDVGLGLAQAPEGRLWRLSRTPLAVQSAQTFRWNDGITLSGYTLPPGPYRPGGTVPLMLQWQVQAQPQQNYTFFVHIVAEDGTIRGQQDLVPAQGPSSTWQPGKRYADLVAPTLAADAPPGRYRVTLGWYTSSNMQRLALTDSGKDYVTLGELTVTR